MPADPVARGLAATLSGLRYPVFNVLGASSSTDSLAKVNAAIARCKAAGGGTVIFPRIGGYRVSDTITIDFSNCTILLQDDVTLTKTTPTDLSPQIVFSFEGTVSTPISNVSLIADSMVTIDGNASNVTGYTHATGKQHHAVYFRRCKNIRMENIRVTNGLVGCITTLYVLKGLVKNCQTDLALNDNGIYFYGNGEGFGVSFDDTDPETWCSIVCEDCISHDNTNFGMGIFGSVGVTYVNPIIYSCGNNSGTALAGPHGGLGAEFDSSISGANLRNHRLTVINPTIYDCWGHGVFNNTKGSHFLGGRVENTKIPTNYSDTTPFLWGHNFYIQNGAQDTIITSMSKGAGRSGIRLNGDSAQSLYPGLTFGGKSIGNARNGIEGYSISFLAILPEAEISLNGEPSNTNTNTAPSAVNVSNASGNAQGGRMIMSGQYFDNYGRVAQVSSVGELHLTDITGSQNLSAFTLGTGQASAIETAGLITTLMVKNVSLTDSNFRTIQIVTAPVVTYAIVNSDTVTGQQTGYNTIGLTTVTDIRGKYTRRNLVSYDPPSLAAGASDSVKTYTVTGVAVGDTVESISFSRAGIAFKDAYVSATDTVTATPYNASASTLDAAAGNVAVVVRKVGF